MQKSLFLETIELIHHSVIHPCVPDVDKLRRCGYIGRSDSSYLELKFSSQEGKGIKVLTVKKKGANVRDTE